ncbi:hypothetical protein M422DRAFT_779348 [Sphaerobolus stellatus SS14]|uniref:Protein PNS1 n=1 Tax=Sphaerobolus stellatus (strain SS14) TaxID=990650 RepID=A0A0C9VYV8_SPHS4|nr:hypothetical protein M422DRAFT_779348 [Sphaerobolus stellatus SS14]
MPLNFDGYTLPYVGLTGESFEVSSRRAREVTSVKRPRVMPPSYGLLPTLMILSSLTLSALLALTSYLFTAHTLSKPSDAAYSALLTGGMTFLASWFCGGIVGDTADALYLCYCIDKESDSQHRNEVFEVFEGPRPAGEV